MNKHIDKQQMEGNASGAGGRADPGSGKVRSILNNRFVMMLTGPILGFLYVIFMPIIGIITVAALAGSKLMEVLFSLVGRSVSFGWRPASAYLSGKNKKKKHKGTK